MVQGVAPLNPTGGNLPTYLGTAPGIVQNQLPGLATSQPVQYVQPVQPATSSQPSPAIAAPVSGPSASINIGPAPVQRYKAQAERLAKQRSCTVPVNVLPPAKAAVFENYTTTCSNASALAIHCEKGMCKVLSR